MGWGTADVLVIDTPARLEIDLDAFMMTHRQTRARVTMAAVQVDYPQRFGVVTLGKDRVRGFRDKIPMNGEIPADWAGTKPGWINGGIYCIEADLLQRLSPTSQESLAHDVFPRWVDRPGIVPFTRTGYFQPLDTPQSRQAFVADLESGEAEGYKV
jgi:NDP-sugar pyrophosphorylase family protein